MLRLFLNIKVTPRGFWGLASAGMGHRSLPLRQQSSLRHSVPVLCPRPFLNILFFGSIWCLEQDRGSHHSQRVPTALGCRPDLTGQHCLFRIRESSKSHGNMEEFNAHPTRCFSCPLDFLKAPSSSLPCEPHVACLPGLSTGQPVKSPFCGI